MEPANPEVERRIPPYRAVPSLASERYAFRSGWRQEIIMTGVEIGIADSGDLDGISSLRNRIWEDTTSSHKTSALGVNDIERSAKRITFIARKDAIVVGYLSLHNGTSLQEPVDADFEMFVLPEAQGKGIGTMLMRVAEEYAATETNISRLTLGVLNDNPNARRLYERNGFYSLGKDSIGERMAKDIKR